LKSNLFDRGIHAVVPPDGRAAINQLGVVAFAAVVFPAAAADLAVGLGTDVTAIDPHYHNLTPNNNVAAHIFGYLVERNEKSQLQPGLATEWKTIDPVTWEFKLRKGVKFHDGTDFTAADVVASIERVPTVPNSPSPFTPIRSRSKEIVVVDPLTIRFKTATPYPLMPSDMTQVAIVSKAARKATTDDFNTGKAAIGTGPYKLVRYAKGDRIELARNDAYWGGKTPWEKVTLRCCRRMRPASPRSCPVTCRSSRSVPTSDDRGIAQGQALQAFRTVADRLIYLHMDSDRDASPFVTDKAGKPLPKKPAQGSPRSQGDLEGDQPAGDGREGDGGRGGSGGTARPGFPVRCDRRTSRSKPTIRRARRSCSRSGLPRRLRPHHSRAQQPLRQRREGRAGGRADAVACRHRHQGDRDAVGDVFHAGDRSQVQLHAVGLEHRAPANRRRRSKRC
jgi:hypothetical protein